MSDERERCLGLLGLKPGAAAQEIKAAYRDMAKVWHPDRFAHDPRLQEKAQNKLKEINEAYEALTANTFNRQSHDTRARTEAGARREPQTSSGPAGGKYLWAAAALLVCVAAAVLFIYPRLSNHRSLLMGDTRAAGEARDARPMASDAERGREESPAERDETGANRKDKKGAEKLKSGAATPGESSLEARVPPPAIPTVTVTIDPTTGQLATAACPIKSSMTYVGGQEPREYCRADHRSATKAEAKPEPSPEKKSRLKTLAGALSAPGRWLKNKTRPAADEN